MKKALSPEQLQEAEALFREGLSNRKIAKHFGVGKTVIWDNIFASKPRQRVIIPKNQRYLYPTIKTVTIIIRNMRWTGYTSGQVANELQIPLEEVNYIYCTTPPHSLGIAALV